MPIRVLMLLVLALPLASCVSDAPVRSFEPEIIDPARAVVYVFRAERPARKRPVRIFINQAPAGALLPGQYLAWTVRPGESLIRVEADASSARPVVLAPGEAAYMQVLMPSLGPARPTIEVPDSESARPLISRTVRSGPS